jgi:hypothetical protein
MRAAIIFKCIQNHFTGIFNPYNQHVKHLHIGHTDIFQFKTSDASDIKRITILFCRRRCPLMADRVDGKIYANIVE